MNKKVIFAIIAVIVIAVLAVGGYFMFRKPVINIDLATLNTEISAKNPFDKMASMPINKEVAKNLYQIEENEIEEIIGKMPMMNVHASMYVVIKATDGNVENVKSKIENYGKSYEEQWAMYLPAQHELVQNRKIGTKGNYVYMIICENAEEIEALIK